MFATGKATIRLLPRPFKASLFLVGHPGELFPAIAAVLRAPGVSFVLHGKTSLVGTRVATLLDRIPDVPHDRFDIDIFGGKNGVLVPKRSFCEQGAGAVEGNFSAYNGKRSSAWPKVKVSGCKRGR
jgi:hypothetical protein